MAIGYPDFKKVGSKIGRLLEIVIPLHKATKRDYLARMIDDKVDCMRKARNTSSTTRMAIGATDTAGTVVEDGGRPWRKRFIEISA